METDPQKQHKKSVDEIWKELNAKARAQAVPRSATSGIPGFGIPGVQTHTRVLPSKPQQQSAGQALSTLQQHLAKTPQQQQPSSQAQTAAVQAAALQYDVTAAGLSQEQVQAYVATLQRTINCLSDPDRSTRRNAAGSLHTKLLKGDATTDKASQAMLQVCELSHTHNIIKPACLRPQYGIPCTAISSSCFGGRQQSQPACCAAKSKALSLTRRKQQHLLLPAAVSCCAGAVVWPAASAACQPAVRPSGALQGDRPDAAAGRRPAAFR